MTCLVRAVTVTASAMQQLVLVAAHSRNLTIGRDGSLPWSIAEDWAHFLRAAQAPPANSCIMGRKVYTELCGMGNIPFTSGVNVVVSATLSQTSRLPDGVVAVPSLEAHHTTYLHCIVPPAIQRGCTHRDGPTTLTGGVRCHGLRRGMHQKW